MHNFKGMLKRTGILFSVWFFCQTALVACCSSSEFEYSELYAIGSRNFSIQDLSNETSAVSADNYRLVFEANVIFIASNTFASGFLGTAYALQCDDDSGRSGMKNKVASIAITADNDFKGFAPGTKLNALFNTYLQESSEDAINERKVVEEIINDLNNRPFLHKWILELKDKTTKQGPIAFTITITQEDGRQLTHTTNPVQLI